MRTARMAPSSSGNGVLAVSTSAACSDSQDLSARLRKRSSPGALSASSRPNTWKRSRAGPSTVKSSGRAASTKGRASAARRSM